MVKINLIFSTRSIENTFNLLKSIQKNISLEMINNISYSFSVYIFDKTIEQNLRYLIQEFDYEIIVITLNDIEYLEQKYIGYLESANCSNQIDSIQRARIQQQIYVLEHKANFKNTIVWQVDDDMLLANSIYKENKHVGEYSINHFQEIVNMYTKNKGVDAIIAPSTYVPPIPSLLYCETQLNDFFNHSFESEEIIDGMEYHDYYMNNDKKTYPLFLSDFKDEDAIVRDILIGKPVTRVSSARKTNQKTQLLDSKFLRGGNFIVFNLDIFNIPHLGFSEKNNTPARRSDMIHAHLLSELGFEIRDTNQISLVHNRTFTEANIEKCSKKYFSDMIGALLIQYLYKGEK
jgi:hypothetical protein